MVIVMVVAVWALCKKKHGKQKVLNTSDHIYSHLVRAYTAGRATTNTKSAVPDPGNPIALYDVAQPEHLSGDKTVKVTSCNNDKLPPSYDMIRTEEVHYNVVPKESSENPSPQYETVASARAGSPTTKSGPPPSLPPRIQQDPNAPLFPLPFDPTAENSAEELDQSVRAHGKASPPPPLPSHRTAPPPPFDRTAPPPPSDCTAPSPTFDRTAPLPPFDRTAPLPPFQLMAKNKFTQSSQFTSVV